MEVFFSLDGLVSLLTLSVLEIVLGIDNIIFISLVSNQLPEHQQRRARQLGLALALGFRVVMLLGITWLIGLTKPIFEIMDHAVSGRDAILFAGGVFLLWKSTVEIFRKTEGEAHGHGNTAAKGLLNTVIQIALLDIVFSFDSVLTAIGMTKDLPIMIAAVVISMAVMLAFAKSIATFIEKHISLQILALSFLILIGTVLVAESAHVEIPKPYVYSSVGFALVVQLLSIRAAERRKAKETTAA